MSIREKREWVSKAKKIKSKKIKKNPYKLPPKSRRFCTDCNTITTWVYNTYVGHGFAQFGSSAQIGKGVA